MLPLYDDRVGDTTIKGGPRPNSVGEPRQDFKGEGLPPYKSGHSGIKSDRVSTSVLEGLAVGPMVVVARGWTTS